MPLFYSTLTELNFFTLSVNSLLFNQPCPHCQCSDQWVSHGFNYNQAGQVRGKRIVCCARFGKRGCGRQAYRWLNALYAKLGDFRVCLSRHLPPVSIAHHRSGRLSSLISTLKVMVSHFPDLSGYQHKMSRALC